MYWFQQDDVSFLSKIFIKSKFSKTCQVELTASMEHWIMVFGQMKRIMVNFLFRKISHGIVNEAISFAELTSP